MTWPLGERERHRGNRAVLLLRSLQCYIISCVTALPQCQSLSTVTIATVTVTVTQLLSIMLLCHYSVSSVVSLSATLRLCQQQSPCQQHYHHVSSIVTMSAALSPSAVLCHSNLVSLCHCVTVSAGYVTVTM